MKTLFLFISVLFSVTHNIYGQENSKICSCPKNEFTDSKPDTVFTLSNRKKIALCGYRNTEDKPVTFSEFVLSVCGQNQIIDFWGAVKTCYVKTKRDTLIVEDLVNLPIGKNFSYKRTVWASDKIYFKDQKQVKYYSVNRKIPKYSKTDILKVLKESEESKGKMDDIKIELANKLFIATISGSPTARKYFNQFEVKYGGLDGAFAEEFSDLKAMLKQWDTKY